LAYKEHYVDNQDLFEYLYDTYMQELSGDSGAVSEGSFSMADDAAVKKFCEFARAHLEVNAPISMGFEDTGVGFQLQDGTHLVFVEQRSNQPDTPDGSIPVTMATTSNRGMSSMRSGDDSVAITEGKEGNDKK